MKIGFKPLSREFIATFIQQEIITLFTTITIRLYLFDLSNMSSYVYVYNVILEIVYERYFR